MANNEQSDLFARVNFRNQNQSPKKTKSRQLSPSKKAQKQMDNFFSTITKLLKNGLKKKKYISKYPKLQKKSLMEKIDNFPENKKFLDHIIQEKDSDLNECIKQIFKDF